MLLPDEFKKHNARELNNFTGIPVNFIFLHTRVGDSRCVSKWYTTYVGDRFSEVMTQ